jgi:hypothetical protein
VSISGLFSFARLLDHPERWKYFPFCGICPVRRALFHRCLLALKGAVRYRVLATLSPAAPILKPPYTAPTPLPRGSGVEEPVEQENTPKLLGARVRT